MKAALAGLLLAGALGGCATAPGATRNPADPWEAWNRKVFAFNEAVDEAVLKPVATTYVDVVPRGIRSGINNVFGNVSDAWSAINNFLQGNVSRGLQDVVRVGTNTLFGIFGVFDVATELGIDRQNEDFGQTLGRWGVGPGPYLVLPLLGPSSLRDTAALPVDRKASLASQIGDDASLYALTGLQIVNTRANLLGAGKLLDDISLDKYSFLRDAYLQRRRSLVRDGEPEAETERFDLPPPEPAGGAASAPAK
jgi:phospholipid-binding lipoprotein MlaA